MTAASELEKHRVWRIAIAGRIIYYPGCTTADYCGVYHRQHRVTGPLLYERIAITTLCLVGISAPLVRELSISTLSVQLQLATFCFLWCGQNWDEEVKYSD